MFLVVFTGEDMEDLISVGTIGLIKAIESYHFNKGTIHSYHAEGGILPLKKAPSSY